MGLLTILRKLKSRQRHMRLLLLGLDNAGKTSVMHALLGTPPVDADGAPTPIAPTVGFDIHTLTVGGGGAGAASAADAPATRDDGGVGGDGDGGGGGDGDGAPPPTTIHVWDVGGQASIRPFWRNYFDATDGLLFVVDAADAARLPAAGRVLAQVCKEERLAGVPLCVLANKQDVAGAVDARAVAAALGLLGSGEGADGEEGEEEEGGVGLIGDKRHWMVFPCTAMGGGGGRGGEGGGRPRRHGHPGARRGLWVARRRRVGPAV
ncbi:hypothetical protein BU14_0736s0002 [Porphyra umbilicalis]|uniref:Uncharacterized protein n=1 Tax=Porphyra umbilicalis TaxID=2786 RepID=A0A1X6NPC8_PORUM|nr:hypothetical protein BU14_0736s0002 [Porphyra umbilicalis]|eukprot:OSX70509.1 hypothetical protein BU14_0736s0002 [Porphyra umbilicalis]